MELDCYKVDILHYLNPHLIWVEVVDPKRDEEFIFEQIGIYGLLPYETTIARDGGGLVCQRCPDWVQATTVAMKKALSDAIEIFFQPTYIDRRSSIFDDNIHKYGEIIIKTIDGAKLELSEILVDSGFALKDVCLFHKELSLGNIKTKLSNTKVREVIKYLEKDGKERERKVKKQTSVFQAAQNFETVLTTKNLERHNRQLSVIAVENLVQKKMKDFDRCKEVEEESVGRGITLKSAPEENKPSLLLKKKMEFLKLQQSKMVFKEQKKDHNPMKVLLATKKFLEKNAKNIEESENMGSENFNSVNKFSNDEIETSRENTDLENAIKTESQDNTNVSYTENLFASPNNSEISKHSGKSMKKVKKSPKRKIPDYDIATERLVAYGPPGINKTLISMKVVPREIKEGDLVSGVEHKEEVILKDKEPFADVDSNVNFEITNRDILKESFSTEKENIVVIDNTNKDTLLEDKCNVDLNRSVKEDTKQEKNKVTSRFAVLQRKMKLHKEISSKKSECSATSHSDTTNKDSSSDDVKSKKERNKSESISYLDSDDDVAEIVQKINEKYGVTSVKANTEAPKDIIKAAKDYKNNVNPFKNVDDSMSVFVDKLVAPVLMVHSKMDKRIEPCSSIRDVHFNTHIHVVLKNMSIERPMMLQMISWPVVLRGYSLFLVSPLGSGKTMGYLPAVCRLVTDFNIDKTSSVGPCCIIVCATAQGVAEIEKLARMFLGVDEKVLACFVGMDELHMTTSLLNGSDLFICTPPVLVRLLQLTDFGVDLRRLSTFVLDDCERLSEVYAHEIKYFLSKIKEMYKNRVNKEHKVQFVAASRVWCDFMEPLAKKAPNSVICIGAFQECVLYSKTNTVVDFVKKDNKIKHVLDFLKDIDKTRKTVIVCRNDDEVEELGKILAKHKYIVFICNNKMTVEELYNLSKSWVEYQEPLLGPILICCDGNLTHLNATDANYLIHYSLPHLFSMFCKRFSVLNDNYSSIFKEERQNVKIKVFLEENNVEQLPKILNFIKRCTDNVPEFLGQLSDKILQEKDVIKGKNHVPICDSLLALGECPDFWNCLERHGVFKEYDQPKDWMPKSGIVTFKILHYHTAIHYSARLLSNSTKGNIRKYPQTYSMLSLKMGMYFSKEKNRKLHGIPKVGDVCAVSIKQNFFVRCQVLKILSFYTNGTPNAVLINLLDEERLERSRDIYLYYLPNDLKEIETHIVQVRLANIRPKDNDVTFSDLAKNQLKKITDKDEDLYLRGQVAMTVGNCVFVDTLDACQELTSLNETVVRYNFKKELLGTHAIPNSDHMMNIQSICKDIDCVSKAIVTNETTTQIKRQLKHQWAHLEKDDYSQVFFSSAENPGTFFVRLTKFEPCMKSLLKEIDKYVEGHPTPVINVEKGDIVLAKSPEDDTFERARIDEILDGDKVKCFFVDNGDWSVVLIKDLLQIPDKLISLMPFQAIECSLIGINPAGEDWTEFGTNWFTCACSETKDGDIKQLYVKYFSKGKADHTNGHQYGVVLIDTTAEQDVLINQLMIDLNLAQAKEDELHFFNELNVKKPISDQSSSDTELDVKKENFKTEEDDSENVLTSLVPVNTQQGNPNVSLDNVFLKKPIRSVPLVGSDSETDDSDKWDIVNGKALMTTMITKTSQSKAATVPADRPAPTSVKTPPKNFKTTNNVTKPSPNESLPSKAHTGLGTSKTSEVIKKLSTTLDSDDLSSAEGSQLSAKVKDMTNNPMLKETHEFRKPKLFWRQNKSSVWIKIQLIGADNYNLEISEKSLKFEVNLNDTNYGFDFELYGIVETKLSTHSNKGQYILVKLCKIIKKNWLTLTRDGSIRKWIVYDVDSIDTSSSEEEEAVNHIADVVKNIHNRDRDSESDDDLLDDINYEYKRDSD